MTKSQNLNSTPALRDQGEGSDFKLERYKFILQQISTLNDNIHKYLTLFQTLATAIVGGGVAVFVSWKSLGISAEIARRAVQGLLGLLVVLALFVSVLLIVSIASWYDYRKEEVAVLNEVVGSGFRKEPKLRNFWRWHETYLLLFVALVALGIFIFVENSILPLIS